MLTTLSLLLVICLAGVVPHHCLPSVQSLLPYHLSRNLVRFTTANSFPFPALLVPWFSFLAVSLLVQLGVWGALSQTSPSAARLPNDFCCISRHNRHMPAPWTHIGIYIHQGRIEIANRGQNSGRDPVAFWGTFMQPCFTDFHPC